jgi:YD repeat-containing protein
VQQRQLRVLQQQCRVQLAASVAGAADFQNQYAYDGLSRVTQITQQGQPGGNAVAPKRVDFSYNAVGQSAQISRYHDLAGTQLVAASGYGYDAAGRLTSLAHTQGASTFNSYAWAYDNIGRVTQQTSSDGTDNYTYDPASQLTAATHSYQANESYSYDANGNRTNTGYQTGTNNRLLSDGVFTYEYDAEGNRTRQTEISTGNYVTYAWDHHNRLTDVKFYTSGGALTQPATHATCRRAALVRVRL